MAKSRATGFPMPHLVAFGLEITERHPNTHEVTNSAHFPDEKTNQVKSVYITKPLLL